MNNEVIELDVKLSSNDISILTEETLPGVFVLKSVLFAVFSSGHDPHPNVLDSAVKPIMAVVNHELGNMYKKVGKVYGPKFSMQEHDGNIVAMFVTNDVGEEMESPILKFKYTPYQFYGKNKQQLMKH